MNPDRVINATVDLINGDLSKEDALQIIKDELDDTCDLESDSKDEIILLIEKYKSGDNLGKFNGEISKLLSESKEFIDHVYKLKGMN